MSALDGHDRRIIAQARELADLPAGLSALREFTGEDDAHAAAYVAFYRAQTQVDALLRLIERLADADEDARRLDRIREVFAHFDWEYHDRQLALEAIERIVVGGEGQAVEPEDGPAADTFTCCTTPMPWPTQDQDRICPDCGTIWEREPVDIGAGARIKSAGCAETSDGAHTGDWYDGGRCGACGLFGPDDEPEPGDPGPEADDEGGMSEYHGWLP